VIEKLVKKLDLINSKVN